jgi:hypothetical protein
MVVRANEGDADAAAWLDDFGAVAHKLSLRID